MRRNASSRCLRPANFLAWAPLALLLLLADARPATFLLRCGYARFRLFVPRASCILNTFAAFALSIESVESSSSQVARS